MKLHLRQSHQKNLWFVDLWSDGSIEVWSVYKRRMNAMHRLTWKSEMDGYPLPAYVIRMIREAQELYRYEKGL